MHLLTWETPARGADGIKIQLQRDTFVSDYAILSHRWGKPEDEVSYEDMLTGGYEHKKGYAKLIGCCEQARRDGLRHVWVDTCCINKSSSAELSEAITSMFTYYEQAKVCYAFLDDVQAKSNPQDKVAPPSFSRSVWFTRGWTLQELIAPTRVKFFDASWSSLGYKTDKWLTPAIESATGIDSIVLSIPATTKVMSIAKKMSWASRRQTTRVEDMAYSLMGIFGVYMAPLYGEGTHAFVRLQEAIMKTSNDQSIFAWTSPPTAPLGHGFEHVSTMLALSPRQFQGSSNFKPLSGGQHIRYQTKLDYATTNAGLSICLPIFKIRAAEGLYVAFLACTESDESIPSAIFLNTGVDTPPGHFWRTNSNNGPIERGAQRWFEISRRDAVRMQDIYILPRFTSVSKQNIEPAWGKVDMGIMTWGFLPRFMFPAQPASTPVLDHLQHVPDPGANQLLFLHQAHRLIHIQQADKLADEFHLRLRSRTARLPTRNESFCGRSDVLQKLADTFFPSEKEGSRTPGICTLFGRGGIGKTQVGVEFSHYCIETRLVDLALWIQADSFKTLMQGFSDLASDFKLVEPQSSNESIIVTVKLWLYNLSHNTGRLGSKPVNWLLVFDNAYNADDVMPFLPSDGAGRVLLTSRNCRLSFEIGSDNIILKGFTVQESQDVLRKLTGIDRDYTELATFLCGHPLVLALAASVAVRKGFSPEEFVSWFKRQWHNQRRLNRLLLMGSELLEDGKQQQLVNSRRLIMSHNSHFNNIGIVSTLAHGNALTDMSFSTLALLQAFSVLDPAPNHVATRITVEWPDSELDLAQSREQLLGKLS